MRKSFLISNILIRISFLIVLCLLFVLRSEVLFAEAASDKDSRIASVIKKVIDAYGGKEAVEAIHALQAKGDIEALMLHDRGTYELYFERGRKLRVDTKYARSSERRILNGDKGYRSTDTLPLEEVFGPRYLAMVYQYKHLNLLHDLAAGTYNIRFEGISSVNGADAQVFEVNDKDGANMDIYIDAHTFFIVKVTGYFAAQNKSTYLSAEFSDFRKVDGTIFPFTITNYAGGIKVARTVFDKYVINPDIADSIFDPATIKSF
jgi:hypothetical protein